MSWVINLGPTLGYMISSLELDVYKLLVHHCSTEAKVEVSDSISTTRTLVLDEFDMITWEQRIYQLRFFLRGSYFAFNEFYFIFKTFLPPQEIVLSQNPHQISFFFQNKLIPFQPNAVKAQKHYSKVMNTTLLGVHQTKKKKKNKNTTTNNKNMKTMLKGVERPHNTFLLEDERW